jgi:hypothetical protein
MTKQQVKAVYDDKGLQAHRLMEINIHPKYKYIDGDLRCAGTYINDSHGSSMDSNVIFEENENVEDLQYLVPIKTLRKIKSGEELLITYGIKFYASGTSASTQIVEKVYIILIF